MSFHVHSLIWFIGRPHTTCLHSLPSASTCLVDQLINRHFFPNPRCILRCKYTIHRQKNLKIFYFIDALTEQFHLSNYSIVNKMFGRVFVRSFVCFLVLRPRPTATVISGQPVILTLIYKFFRNIKRGSLHKYIQRIQCLLTKSLVHPTHPSTHHKKKTKNKKKKKKKKRITLIVEFAAVAVGWVTCDYLVSIGAS